MYPEPEAVKRQRKDCGIFERIKDWTDGEIETALDATSDNIMMEIKNVATDWVADRIEGRR